MKTIDEIETLVTFPQIIDIFGNEVKPGDIITYTVSGNSRILNSCVVTNKFTNGDRLILIDIINESRCYLDLKEVNEKTCTRWHKIDIIKINDILPFNLKDKAEAIRNKFVSDMKNKKKIAEEKRKSAIQVRFFTVFFMNKKTNELSFMFKKLISQPGKVIGNSEINAAKLELMQKYPDYIMATIDTDLGISMINTMRNKPKLHSINKTCHWWSKSNNTVDYNLLDVSDTSWYNLTGGNDTTVMNQLIPIYTEAQAKYKTFKQENYKSRFSNNLFHYAFQYNATKNGNEVLPLGNIFSDEALKLFKAFHHYCETHI